MRRLLAVAPAFVLALAPTAAVRQDVRRYIRNHPRSLRELTRTQRRRKARRTLTAVHEQRAVTKFIREYRSRWRALTVCSHGYVIAECSNGPPLP